MSNVIDPSTPVELRIEKARQDIINSINRVGQVYDLPGVILAMIVKDIFLQTQVESLESLVSYLEVSKTESEQEPIDDDSDVAEVDISD